VVDNKLPAGRPVRDQLVGERYYEFLSIFLRNKAAVAVITWGLSDRYSWLNKIDKYRRSDQLPLRPLPYDADLRPKGAWDAIAKAFDLKKSRNR
jgi:endo-1,4-beta-xylanase